MLGCTRRAADSASRRKRATNWRVLGEVLGEQLHRDVALEPPVERARARSTCRRRRGARPARSALRGPAWPSGRRRPAGSCPPGRSSWSSAAPWSCVGRSSWASSCVVGVVSASCVVSVVGVVGVVSVVGRAWSSSVVVVGARRVLVVVALVRGDLSAGCRSPAAAAPPAGRRPPTAGSRGRRAPVTIARAGRLAVAVGDRRAHVGRARSESRSALRCGMTACGRRSSPPHAASTAVADAEHEGEEQGQRGAHAH